MSTGSLPWPQPVSFRAGVPRGDRPPRWLAASERRGWLALSDSLGVGATLALPHPPAGSLLVQTLVLLASLYATYRYDFSVPAAADRGFLVGSAIALMLATASGEGVAVSVASLAIAWLWLRISRRHWSSWWRRRAKRPVLLLGEADEVAIALTEIERHPECGLTPLGWLPAEAPGGREVAVPVLGTLAHLPVLVETHEAVVVAGRSALASHAWRRSLAPDDEVFDLPTLFEQLSRRVPVRSIDERWLIEQFGWTRGATYQVLKRGCDVVAALLGLAIGMVLLPGVAIAIRLEDGGPLFYGQERVGRHGRPFKLYKIRTMRPDAERDGAVWARREDDRVTRVGRWLRRSRLDEVPQLWNVLKGEMSLVGPRPERPEFTRELERRIPFYSHRHLVLPGLTGWAQVRYPYGASIAEAEEKLQYDLYYLKHRSLFFDLLIALRTVAVVVTKAGSR